eukprot:scaffold208432_cov45-Prasinocladus_malaysianus.AAC.1
MMLLTQLAGGLETPPQLRVAGAAIAMAAATNQTLLLQTYLFDRLAALQVGCLLPPLAERIIMHGVSKLSLAHVTASLMTGKIKQ